MSAPAAISGSLVNMRNVGTHKSVALTVHIPEEHAQQVIAAFGWPTAAAPVAVALARLNAGVEPDAQPEPTSAPAQKERRRFQDLPPAQQAAMACSQPAFQTYLFERFSIPKNDASAAEHVRKWCGVKSRSDIKQNTDAGASWLSLYDQFQAWMQVAA